MPWSRGYTIPRRGWSADYVRMRFAAERPL